MGEATISDRSLLVASVNGDQRAFAALIDRHTPALTRYAWALMSSRSDVQDVLQETWTTAWNKRASVRIVDSSMLPWLLVVCRNQSLNARRRNSKHQTDPLLDDLVPRETWGEAREQLRWVLGEIEQLSERDRQLCQLCLIDGVSYKDAAADLGTTSAAARKRIERLRIRLRNAVTPSD